MPTKPKGSNETIETAQKSGLQRNMFHYSLISVFAQTTRSRTSSRCISGVTNLPVARIYTNDKLLNRELYCLKKRVFTRPRHLYVADHEPQHSLIWLNTESTLDQPTSDESCDDWSLALSSKQLNRFYLTLKSKDDVSACQPVSADIRGRLYDHRNMNGRNASCDVLILAVSSKQLNRFSDKVTDVATDSKAMTERAPGTRYFWINHRIILADGLEDEEELCVTALASEVTALREPAYLLIYRNSFSETLENKHS
ncbi:hypothetical protein FRACYDRAFT_243671 [Fragilariopsis cylindrus CCMP1102]|uniref:Uncharacterized protein n=1 Tax=Fragilariopsis cylindrus CCMP1102 TaxID=635003 RepID=A0A1E7F4K1_9STRA|nr:hypothetical protein FRACYDRAFT_243671 [Fragilariopsis cylindrus CCMP1102]|eukprot:OEU13111.1 hypothetical protein FRACYDRAFT_243671 [Fragilariopsis cylindrus CCMP1102]